MGNEAEVVSKSAYVDISLQIGTSNGAHPALDFH